MHNRIALDSAVDLRTCALLFDKVEEADAVARHRSKQLENLVKGLEAPG